MSYWYQAYYPILLNFFLCANLEAAILKSTVAAAEADLQLINDTIQAFEAVRITKDTSVGELQHRFPQIARKVEQEIKGHLWNGPIAENADKHGH